MAKKGGNKNNKQPTKDDNAPTQDKPQKPQLFDGWTGKTPVTLLNEYAQKQATWSRVDYNMHGGPRTGYQCTVRLSSTVKGQQTPVTVSFKPVATQSTQERHASALEARHVAAAYALHRLRSNTNMHRMLPPIHRSYWNDLEEIRKGEGERGSWKYSEDPFVTKVAHIRDREDKSARREKESARKATAKRQGRLEELLSPRLKNRWDELAQVHMSDTQRSAAEIVIRTWTKKWDRKSAETDPSITRDLIKMGFRDTHVHEAAQYAHTRQGLIDWLCVHVPEDDVPERIMQSAYKSTLVVVDSESLGVRLSAKRVSHDSGFSLSLCTKTLARVLPDDPSEAQIRVGEAACVAQLVAKLCEFETPHEQSLDALTQTASDTICDELAALDAIYAGETDRVTHVSPNHVSLAVRARESKHCPADVRIEVWVTGEYPATPAALTVSSDSLPAYLRLHCTKQLNTLVPRSGMPILFESITTAEDLIDQWIAAPPPLATLMGGLLPSQETLHRGTERSQPRKRNTRRAASPDLSRVRDEFEKLQQTAAYGKMRTARERLPAWAQRSHIVDTVARHRCTIVSGATGCGKSTQVPQFLLDSATQAGERVRIICTQPRRISAIGVASRVAEERCEAVGGTVGYAVRGESRRGAETRLEFCTTGVLLRMLHADAALDGVTHVVCDEVHERSVDSDMLLALLRVSLERNRKLHVVLMSATAQCDAFARYFDAPIVDVPGRTFPVADVYADDFLGPAEPVPRKLVDPAAYDIDYALCTRIVAHIHATADPSLAVLVFMPGAREIDQCVAALRALPDTLVLPLHAGLAHAEQRRVFSHAPHGSRKVVVATNIAETSITIDDIGFVVDSGRAKEPQFDAATRIPRLATVFCSRAAAAQRKGRAGRVQSGTCYRLYTRLAEQSMRAHATPEIQRTPLEQACLSAKAMGYVRAGDLLGKLLDPPASSAVDTAQTLLAEIGASDGADGALTPLGEYLARIPVDLRLAKVLVYGAVFGLLNKALIIVALMAAERPLFITNRDSHARIQVAHSGSDWLRALAVYEQWEALRGSARRDFCTHNSVSMHALRDAQISIRELRTHMQRTHLASHSHAPSSPMLNAIIFAGLFPNIARVRHPQQKFHEVIRGTVGVDHSARELAFYLVNSTLADDWKTYDFRRDTRAFVHPQSALFEQTRFTTPFIAFFGVVSTSKVFLRDVTMPGLYALLFFGSRLVVDHDNGVVCVGGGAIALRAMPRIAALVSNLRELLSELLKRKLDDPELEICDHPVVKTIVGLIETDGQ